MSSAQDLSDKMIASLDQFPGGRLPSIRMLANQFKVSTRTVQKSLKILVRRGVLESSTGAGYWLKGNIPVTQTKDGLDILNRKGAEAWAEQLRQDILEGRYAWEQSLPSMKELANAWECHVQTVSKALELVVQSKILRRQGRQHIPVRPLSKRNIQKPVILCLASGDGKGNFRMDSERESDFWRALDYQAAEAGLELCREQWTGQPIKIDVNMVGVIASTWHSHDPMALCRALAKIEIPVCLWVEEHILQGPSLDSRIRFHDLGYTLEIGKRVGEHLLELGHSHLAFISPWHSSQWSRNRLRGIQSVMDRISGTVELFHLDYESQWDHLVPAQQDVKLQKHFPSKALANLIEGSTDDMLRLAQQSLGFNRLRREMEDLFKDALKSGATAWVGSNDHCALQALHWLRKQGIKVPEQISVVGFDDSIQALRSNMTSFRFSSDSIARSMLYQILANPVSPVLTRHYGHVVKRKTSSNAPLNLEYKN